MHVERSAAGVCPGCTPTVSFQFNSEAPVFVTVSSHDTLYYSLYEYETLGRVKITAIWPGQCITNSSNTCVENYGCASNWFVWLIGIPGTYLGYDVYENGTFQYHTDPIDHMVMHDGVHFPPCGYNTVTTIVADTGFSVTIVTACSNCINVY